MPELSEKEYWDAVHKSEAAQFDSTVKTPAPDERRDASVKSRLAATAKRLLGAQNLERMSGFDDYLLWEVIFKKYLPEMKNAKVLEVGSAPGEFLVRFSREYGCVPYGVEYSDTGVELNRRMFSSHGINPDNVIHADFFSEQFQRQYQNAFDLVVSRGFIEHFTDVENVIAKHVNVLAEGGYLVVNIPNLKGVNYGLIRLFNKEVIAIHNLDIMRREAFAKLFDRDELQRLFCDYYGTFSFYLFNARDDSPMRLLLNSAYKLQPALNLAFRLLLKNRGAESRLFSPHLLFIGKKTKRT
jgi:SAM-dependent methyltransferase